MGRVTESVRLVCASKLPFSMNLFRNERFLFDNSFDFPDRIGPASHYSGEGDFLPLVPGKHMWETNFVPDLASFALPEWEARGAGSRNIKIILADSCDACACVGNAGRRYKKGASAWTRHACLRGDRNRLHFAVARGGRRIRAA